MEGEANDTPNLQEENNGNPTQNPQGVSVRAAVVNSDFFLLFVVHFIGSGSGLAVGNNLMQIGSAVMVERTAILFFVWSLSNFLGRLLAGVISDFCSRASNKKIPHAAWIVVSQLLIVAAFFLYAFHLKVWVLYVFLVSVGAGYGAVTSLVMPTILKLYGADICVLLFNILSLGNPVGVLIFSWLVTGQSYDKEAAKYGGSCEGAHCFREAFGIAAVIGFVGIFLGILYCLKVWNHYQGANQRRLD